MKSNNYLWIIAIIALLGSLYATWQTRLNRINLAAEICRHEKAQCESACDQTFLHDTLEIAISRSNARLNHAQALLACRVDNIGSQAAIDACQQTENDRFNRQMGQLDAQVQVLLNARDACRDSCTARAAECAGGDDDLPQKIDVPFTIDCIDGNNAPCFKPVPDICKLVNDVCQDCLNSLCPGSDWYFQADAQVTITLVAATSEKETGRDLAKSSMKDDLIKLEVPDNVKLKEGENLYLRFTGDKVSKGMSIHLRGYAK